MSAESSKKVLIVEDDPDTARLLKTIQKDFNTVEKHSGNDALRSFDLEKFDLVLSDIVMNDGDGFSLLKELKRRADTVPVIMISGQNEVAQVEKAIGLGACDYILKPFQRDTVVAKVRQRLQQYHEEHWEFPQGSKIQQAIVELDITLKEVGAGWITFVSSTALPEGHRFNLNGEFSQQIAKSPIALTVSSCDSMEGRFLIRATYPANLKSSMREYKSRLFPGAK